MIVSHKFYGYVKAVYNNSFDAVFKERGDDSQVYLGNIPIGNVSEEEQKYIAENAIFEWEINGDESHNFEFSNLEEEEED